MGDAAKVAGQVFFFGWTDFLVFFDASFYHAISFFLLCFIECLPWARKLVDFPHSPESSLTQFLHR